MAEKQPFYRAVIVDAAGDFVEMNEVTSLRFSYALNAAGSAELTLPIASEKVNNLTTTPLQSWLRVYRWDDKDDSSTEALVWYGLLFDLSHGNEDTNGTVSLRYRDIAGILASRYVPKDYSVSTLTDASQILWDLIDLTQSKMAGGENVGDLGIIQGQAPASKDRQPEKDLRNRTILDVMQSFSDNIDGIDWEMTPTPRNSSIGIFNTYFRGAGELYHKGNVIDVPLTYYLDDVGRLKFNNVQSAQIEEVGSEYANNVLMLGSTVDETQLFAEVGNTGQKQAIGLFEDIKSETMLSEQDTIDDRAAEELNSKIVIPYNVNLTMLSLQKPRFGTFDVGDIFTFRYKVYNFRDFERQFRLYKLTVNVDRDGVEKMDLELNNI